MSIHELGACPLECTLETVNQAVMDSRSEFLSGWYRVVYNSDCNLLCFCLKEMFES